MSASDEVDDAEVPVVVLDGIVKRFDSSPPVDAVRRCDLVVEAGDFLTITGTSGSGKSTLLNILGLLDTPSEGRYLFCGDDVSGLDDRARSRLRAQRIGFVFQAFHLLAHRDCVENVALGMLYRGTADDARRERAAAALEQVGMGHRLSARPTTLSGGERQRVAIARALVNEPSLLLCDEPTGNLDTETSRTVLRLIAEVNESGRTVVLVTHDAEVARAGNRRATMSDGMLTATG